VGDTITYTVVLENKCSNELTSLFFEDFLQEELVFVPNSVTVNNIPQLGVDPNDGIVLLNIPGGGQVTITFQAEVAGIPGDGFIRNTAMISYFYTPVLGGIPSRFEENSNTVEIAVALSPDELADVSVLKTPSSSTIGRGDELTYTIVVNNGGPAAAENVILTDVLPAGILNPEYQINGSGFLPWEGELFLGNMGPDTFHTVIITGTVAENAISPIRNTARVESGTPDPNLENNTSTATVRIIAEITDRCQAITDIVQSAALQETAMAHILNAEGKKIQKIAALLRTGGATPEQAAAVNSSASQLVGTLSILEETIQSKLRLLSDSFDECRNQ
jgi:uncharacterized repeat protein (TIGR01451 family)